ncbi:MAG: hypothetical protein ABS81_02255 [Pseudonocardia sp. SCN 72-86]|nr:MAG: hypothetical protein ABS81_02255 [Pseudonocardia sp. SCN 72-86]
MRPVEADLLQVPAGRDTELAAEPRCSARTDSPTSRPTASTVNGSPASRPSGPRPPARATPTAGPVRSGPVRSGPPSRTLVHECGWPSSNVVSTCSRSRPYHRRGVRSSVAAAEPVVPPCPAYLGPQYATPDHDEWATGQALTALSSP